MSKLCTLISLLYFLQQGAFAQTDSTVNQYPISDNVLYEGGEQRIREILAKNFRYPQHLPNDSIQGTVFVYFTIDTNGHSKDITIIKGIGKYIDNEAMRCVDLLDSWIPGSQNGRKVEMHHILPIKFSFSESRSRVWTTGK